MGRDRRRAARKAPAGASARAKAARLAARHRARTITAAIGAGAVVAAAVVLSTGSVGGALLTGAAAAVGAFTAQERPSQARAWAVGAEGEEATAALLGPLALSGWTVLHDRAIPGTRANIDHLLISPTGAVVVVDSKRWRRDWTVTLTPDGRLMCGPRPQDRDVASITHEADRVAQTLRVPVHRIIAVHGARVPAGPLRIRHPSGTITVTAAQELPALLRGLPARHPSNPQLLARHGRTPHAVPLREMTPGDLVHVATTHPDGPQPKHRAEAERRIREAPRFTAMALAITFMRLRERPVPGAQR